MKYRIENGEAKVPISELNRVNDEYEALIKREQKLDRIESKLKGNSVATEMTVSVHREYLGYGNTYSKHVIEDPTEHYSDFDGILKKAVDCENKRMQFYLDEKKDEAGDLSVKLTRVKSELAEVENMSVKEFKRYKKRGSL